MMDCDTTGIEPDIALVKYKLLAGGGMLKIVNNTVTMALEKLGYTPDQIKKIINQIERDDTIETAADLKPEHLPVFDCAFKPAQGRRSIHYLAHIKMIAAAQPFISGAISKTVNMPHESTANEIKAAYMTGWKLGLKALAIYRDGSKRSQPLSTKKNAQAKQAKQKETQDTPDELNGELERRPQRIRLPETRRSITHKFDVAGHEGYLTVGLYEDGTPGELFITMAKEGSTVGGLMDAFGNCISMSLQYGVPLGTLVSKFSHARFEPAGMTSNRDIPIAKSLIDYIARWLGMTFLPGYREANAPKRPDSTPAPSVPLWPNNTGDDETSPHQKDKLSNMSNRISELIDIVNKPAIETTDRTEIIRSFNRQFTHFQSDAPVCDACGSITVRNGNCYRCFNCGASMGCS
jgi:ribonucleoside-diphosphate reductase alpha chain